MAGRKTVSVANSRRRRVDKGVDLWGVPAGYRWSTHERGGIQDRMPGWPKSTPGMQFFICMTGAWFT